MKRLFSVLKYVIALFVIFVASVAILPRVPAFGNFQSLVVLSGSMEPAIKTGSVVLVRAQPMYQVGDIITFADSKNLVTHRLITISREKLITKGDANKSSDQREISITDVKGKVILSVPYLGYAANFSRTKLGLALFIILPAILIIISEIKDLLRGSEKSVSAKTNSLCAMCLFFTTAFASGISLAYFSDAETALGNVINVGVWGEEEENVLLNEIMANPVDEDTGEFVELYNPSGNAIDVAGWFLKDAADTNDYLVDFTGPYDWGLSGTEIPSEGYALIVDPEYADDYNSYLNANADPTMVVMITIAADTTLGNGLGNASDTVILDDGGGYTDSFSWANNSGNNRSWEKMDDVWEKSASGGTPGVENGT